MINPLTAVGAIGQHLPNEICEKFPVKGLNDEEKIKKRYALRSLGIPYANFLWKECFKLVGCPQAVFKNWANLKKTCAFWHKDVASFPWLYVKNISLVH